MRAVSWLVALAIQRPVPPPQATRADPLGAARRGRARNRSTRALMTRPSPDRSLLRVRDAASQPAHPGHAGVPLLWSVSSRLQPAGRPTTNTGSQPTVQERPADTCSRRPLFRTVSPYAWLETPSRQNNTRALAVFISGTSRRRLRHLLLLRLSLPLLATLDPLGKGVD
jgi:hypothetical protein